MTHPTPPSVTVMKAAMCTRYGPPEVVEVRDIPRPEPGRGEVRIRVHATAVNSGDARIRGLRVPAGMGLPVRLMFGLKGPRQPVLGTDFAGTVDDLGDGVTAVRKGDRVFGSLGTETGTHAEYVIVAGDGALRPIPDSLSMEDAVAMVFGGTTALSFLHEKSHLDAGEHILINGATGAVGAAAIQLAKVAGATVTAVCSAKNADLARSLGADHVIDYRTDDFTAQGPVFDVVMDNVGNAPWSRARHALKPHGRFLAVVADTKGMIGGGIKPKRGTQTMVTGVASATGDLLDRLGDLHAQGLFRPVISETLPLAEIVRAHQIVDEGHKTGSLVIEMPIARASA